MANTFTKYIHEVLDEASKAPTRKDKIDVLKKNESWALKDILKGTFDDIVVWNLPGGTPPYSPADPSSIPTNLLKQNTQFKYFVRGGAGDKLNPLKRETMFIRLIESIHPKDAEVVLNMINKKSPGKGLTKKLVEEAFPGLIQK